MAGPQEQQPPPLEEVLSDLAVKIERTKQLYEQYFMGIEKMEPLIPRKEVSRAMILLQQQYIRNTGLRFRFQTMLQKWNIYVTYWNRSLREIEAGTYVRHVQRARRNAEKQGKELPKEILPPAQRPGSDPALKKIHDWDSHPGLLNDGPGRPHDSGTATSIPTMGLPQLDSILPKKSYPPPARVSASREHDSGTATAIPTMRDALLPPLDAILPSKPPPPPVQSRPPPLPPPLRAAPPPPPPFKPAPSAKEVTNPRIQAPAPRPSIPGMSEGDLRTLHRQFVDARRAAGEAANVSYDALVSTLAKQVPRVLQTPGAKGVKFEVATQNGKAILKAYPTK